jgi:hypothetical protein
MVDADHGLKQCPATSLLEFYRLLIITGEATSLRSGSHATIHNCNWFNCDDQLAHSSSWHNMATPALTQISAFTLVLRSMYMTKFVE